MFCLRILDYWSGEALMEPFRTVKNVRLLCCVGWALRTVDVIHACFVPSSNCQLGATRFGTDGYYFIRFKKNVTFGDFAKNFISHNCNWHLDARTIHLIFQYHYLYLILFISKRKWSEFTISIGCRSERVTTLQSLYCGTNLLE